MRNLVPLHLALLLCAAPVTAIAQSDSAAPAPRTLEQLRDRQAQLISELESNLTLKESIETSGLELDGRFSQFDSDRLANEEDLSDWTVSCANFQDLEPASESSPCAQRYLRIGQRRQFLGYEGERLHGESLALQERMNVRSEQEGELWEELNATQQEKIELCFRMPADDRVSCNVPPAAGPRTAEVVRSLQARFDDVQGLCAHEAIESKAECERRQFDWSRPNFVPG